MESNCVRRTLSICIQFNSRDLNTSMLLTEVFKDFKALQLKTSGNKWSIISSIELNKKYLEARNLLWDRILLIVIKFDYFPNVLHCCPAPDSLLGDTYTLVTASSSPWALTCGRWQGSVLVPHCFVYPHYCSGDLLQSSDLKWNPSELWLLCAVDTPHLHLDWKQASCT